MSKFWQAFDRLMDLLPGEIEESFSQIQQGGKKIEIRTVNGKTTVKVNGKEYVPKEEAKK